MIYTPKEVCERLRLSDLGYANPEKTLRRWVSRKMIQCTHVGKKIVFTEEHITSYLKGKR